MTITEIKDISAKKVVITLDNYYSFPLYDSEIKKRGFETGTDIPDEVIDDIKRDILFPTALNRSLYLLKTKEYTKQEITQKLSKGYYPDDIVDGVLEELVKNKFIDDKRYAENYISYHSGAKSRQAITSALFLKGVEKDVIEESFDTFEQDNPGYELELCKTLLERKYSAQKEDADFETIKKAEMFLARKGFSYATAGSAVKEFFDI